MKLGIVGLPNVGKSTLFNAITKAGAEAANYPFCTIEPNVGVVTVPDERVSTLSRIYKSKRTIYTTITTLLPVIVLMLLGSSGIFTFNMAMLIGLISGTY